MKQLTLEEIAHDLICPQCKKLSLQAPPLFESIEFGAMKCESCSREFPIEQGVPNFLLMERLDKTNLEEIRGNVYDTRDASLVSCVTNKWNGSAAYVHSLSCAVKNVEHALGRLRNDHTVLVSLGSGTGFELQRLCKRLSFAKVNASDISLSAVSLVPVTLAGETTSVGTFVSEFKNLPLSKRENWIGLVFQALHHTSDIHDALDELLGNSFETLIIVEPTTNWFIEWLARFGLAKRIEYSGLNPSWLDLTVSKKIAEKHKYDLKIETWWEIPPYVSERLDRSALLRAIVTKSVDLFSALTNLISFGSMSCVVFTSKQR